MAAPDELRTSSKLQFFFEFLHLKQPCRRYQTSWCLVAVWIHVLVQWPDDDLYLTVYFLVHWPDDLHLAVYFLVHWPDDDLQLTVYVPVQWPDDDLHLTVYVPVQWPDDDLHLTVYVPVQWPDDDLHLTVYVPVVAWWRPTVDSLCSCTVAWWPAPDSLCSCTVAWWRPAPDSLCSCAVAWWRPALDSLCSCTVALYSSVHYTAPYNAPSCLCRYFIWTTNDVVIKFSSLCASNFIGLSPENGQRYCAQKLRSAACAPKCSSGNR